MNLELNDYTIILCENNLKMHILKNMSFNREIKHIKFFTKKEFIRECTFKYDEKTLLYLIKKYNMKIDIAKMYLDNLYYIKDNVTYKSNKLEFLVNLKKELNNNNLLISNKDFINTYKRYKVLVVEYPYLEEYEKEILNNFSYEVINSVGNYKINDIYNFNDIESEINFVCKSISKLLLDGININKIKLMGVSEDYYNDLERIFSFYNIPIKIPSNNSLYGNLITKKFLNNNLSITDKINLIKDDNKDIVNKIINICNKYSFTNDEAKIDLIKYDLKNTIVDNYKYKDYVEIIDISYKVEDEYIFFMNFNNGSNPIILKDEYYITDNIKWEVNLKEVPEINSINKEYLLNKLKSIKNLIITYKNNDKNGVCYPSILISALNLNIITDDSNITNSYSKLNDLINYTKLLDSYNTYGIYDNKLNIYKNSYDISYREYDNKYKTITKEYLLDYLNNEITLSYSSIDNYNKCAFRYYIANILKLDKYENTFDTLIGSLFHDVLEKCFNNNLVVEDEINNYIKDKNIIVNAKEKYYIDKIIKEIKFVIEVLNKQKEYTTFDKELHEKRIVIDKSNDTKIYFKGYIDKILYKEDSDNTKVSVIDYKTGNNSIDLRYIKYGLNMQLPIYLYLIKESKLFESPKFIGFYLQYILNKDLSKEDIPLIDKKINNLKLAGYSNSDIHSLVEFDNTFENSMLIKSMKVKKDGNFSSNSKVLNDIEIDNIINIVSNNIDDNINKILNADFTINPKNINYENNVGCEYCKFKDICFMTNKDMVILDEVKDLSFLGGEDNA